METGQAVTPMRCPGEHQEVSPWDLLSQAALEAERVVGQGRWQHAGYGVYVGEGEGEINAGGTLAATGLRYSSNELVFDTLYAIWREARSRNGPSRSISSSYVPL